MAKSNIIPASPGLTHVNSLKTLVENRTVFSLEACELNLFETYKKSELVSLKFNDLVVTSMLKGKKVMRLFDKPGFDYLPGESVLIPANVEMKIDFPEAALSNPTQCLALAIDNKKIVDTLEFSNTRYPKEGIENYWRLDERNYFFYNNPELALTINNLINICQSNFVTKDVLADLALQELLIRISQSQNLTELSSEAPETNTYLAQIIQFIRLHITDKLTLKAIASKASISTTSLYRLFKRELGISPVEFIIRERIKLSKRLLKDDTRYIKNISFEVGFEDANYFIRAFKSHEGITPKQYQQLNNKD